MDGPVTQKRTRDEALGEDEVAGGSLGKKLRESAAGGLPDLALTPENTVVAGEAVVGGVDADEAAAGCLPSPADGAASKAILRSLEEELGVSGDDDNDSADLAQSASSVEEELANWGQEIWSVDAFPESGKADGEGEPDVLFTTGVSDAGSSGESLSASSESAPCSRNSPTEGPDAASRPVDIGFLREASDDELGIPPSPTSDREQSSGAVRHGANADNSVDSLQEAVSWALEDATGGDGSAEFSDSGIDDWMIGNLDFIMGSPVVGYGGAVSPLLEAGIMF